MSLRFQLLLLSLLTLLLPWAGWRYAREVETVLRDGEQQALLATAATLANVLVADEDTLAASAAAADPFDPAAGDLYVHRLQSRPLLDGYADDWGIQESAFSSISARNGALEVQYAAAMDEQYLYLLLKVADAEVRLEQTVDASLPPEKRADHLWISLPAADGSARLYLLATSAPGLIGARSPTESPFGQRGERAEPRIQGWWQPDRQGYRLEISVPLAMLGTRLGFEAVDVGDFASLPVRAGTLDVQTRNPLSGRLLMPVKALERKLATLLPPGTRATVANSAGWVIAEAGTLTPASETPYERPSQWLQPFYRRLLESGRALPALAPAPAGRLSGDYVQEALQGGDGAARFRSRDERRSILAVAIPLPDSGALVLEQTADRLLVLRDRALTRLMNITLLATGAAVLAMFVFTSVLGLRLGRLKRAAETALTHDGRVNTSMPDTRARDELGDLARSFHALLRRLNEYTEYLRTLAGKLAHELRTPLTIVRSSIENLESEGANPEINPYLTRAREGADRLQEILAAMGAATRTEEAIRHAERKSFDLAELIRSMTCAYADAFPQRRFEARITHSAYPFYGAPDLIVQLLDKLTENAVDFSAGGSTIEIELRDLRTDEVELCVVNEGPSIPPAIRAHLFESMFQFRGRTPAETPVNTMAHFGLGLYIVRLIAEFHQGEVLAENLTARAAVRFGVRLPLMRAS